MSTKSSCCMLQISYNFVSYISEELEKNKTKKGVFVRVGEEWNNLQIKTEIQALTFNSNCGCSGMLSDFLFKNEIMKNFLVNAYAVPTEMYKTVKWSFQFIWKWQIIWSLCLSLNVLIYLYLHVFDTILWHIIRA